MKLTRFLALAAGVAALSGSAFAQEGLPTQKMLTIDVAQTIAQDAMAQCRANGYKVTVTVVDGGNILKAFLRDDGAGMATVEVGRMKANSVMAFGRPSGPPANLPPGTPAPPPVLPGTINAMGGVPIKVGDQLIGAVSVSGAPGGDKDAACANAALAKVADKLK
ncbi:MAG: heme-binding protein [Bryobacteraceae bacterium]|jgi:uncharacterized protein GlcG (DUF336 family)